MLLCLAVLGEWCDVASGQEQRHFIYKEYMPFVMP